MAANRFERFDRDELWKRWSSTDGFQEIRGKADENGITIGQQVESNSPTNPSEHKYQAVEDILYRRGYDTFDEEDTGVISSPMIAFGKWTKENDIPNTDEANDRLLLDEHLSKCYSRTLMKGIRTKNLDLVKSINTIGALETGTQLNPYYDAAFIRAKLFGTSIDFRRIVGNVTRIREEVYRLPKYNNDPEERKMDRMAEGTTPRMMELDYTQDTLQFELFRKGIEATYDFLNSQQTRVSMIRNAIEEVAEQHRIALFELVVTAIAGGVADERTFTGGAGTGAAASPAGVSGKITFNQWLRFRKRFAPMYSPDIVLGDSESISAFELMFAQFGGGATGTTPQVNNIPIGQFAGMNPMLVRNPMLLNNVPNVPEYGWYDGLSTALPEDSLLVFDRDRSSNLVFQIGSDQDETKREPGPRVIQRFLATKAGVHVPDNNGIYRYRFQA